MMVQTRDARSACRMSDSGSTARGSSRLRTCFLHSCPHASVRDVKMRWIAQALLIADFLVVQKGEGISY